MTITATAARLGQRSGPPPQAGSKPPTPTGGAAPGRNEFGTITIRDSVVAKLAARAATENPDVGAAATTILGVSLPGASLLGTKSTDLHALPKSGATVDGTIATVQLTISVRWPKSVAQVTGELRELVRDRVHQLTGLDVVEVKLEVTDLATSIAGPPRVT